MQTGLKMNQACLSHNPAILHTEAYGLARIDARAFALRSQQAFTNYDRSNLMVSIKQ